MLSYARRHLAMEPAAVPQQAASNPFAFQRRLAADRRRLEHAAWTANPGLQRIIQGVERLALPSGEWALVDLTDRELRRLAGATTMVAA